MKLVGGRIVTEVVRKPAALPPVPLTGDQAQNRFNTAVRQELSRLTSGPERAVTASEVPALATEPPVDNRVPPAPVNLTGTGAFRDIFLEWD